MITYSSLKPMADQFLSLRKAIGWNVNYPIEAVQNSLNSSPYCVTAWDDNKLVGMVRVSGDKFMYGYIQDMIVLPDYQKKGIGTTLLNNLMQIIREIPTPYLIGVCPSKIAVTLYSKHDFVKRPENPNGFMYIELKEKNSK